MHSTLHSNDGPQTIARLRSMGIAPFNITSNSMQIAETAQRTANGDLRQRALVKAAAGSISLIEINGATKD